MFTGIVEKMAVVRKIDREGSNYHFTLETPIAQELKIDQSMAHNGVCLTVVKLDKAANQYTVTAIFKTYSLVFYHLSWHIIRCWYQQMAEIYH